MQNKMTPPNTTWCSIALHRNNLAIVILLRTAGQMRRCTDSLPQLLDSGRKSQDQPASIILWGGEKGSQIRQVRQIRTTKWPIAPGRPQSGPVQASGPEDEL